MSRGDIPAGHSWPSDDEAAALHARLLARDPVATADCCGAYLELLVTHLRHRYPLVDIDICRSAAVEAIRTFVKNPEQYKPQRGKKLAGYLRMSAEGDLKNLLDREAKHFRNRQSWDSVEVAAAVRKKEVGDDPDLPSFDDPALADVIRSLTDAERCVFELMMQGERSTAKFAAALGLDHLSPSEQATEVKRVKDRIKQRFKRAVKEEQ